MDMGNSNLNSQKLHVAIDHETFPMSGGSPTEEAKYSKPGLPPRKRSLNHFPSERPHSMARASTCVKTGKVTLRRRQFFSIILVGKSILLREGLTRILRS